MFGEGMPSFSLAALIARGRDTACEAEPRNVRYVVVTGQSGFGLKTLKADIAVRCLDRLLSKFSINDLPSRALQSELRLRNPITFTEEV